MVGALAAVLWDLDGTLVDTEPLWFESELELVIEHGGQWSREQALSLVGGDLLVSAHALRDHGGVDLEPDRLVDVLLDKVVARVQQRVPWLPGARELLSELRRSDVPCALVTSSHRRFADPVLRALPANTFQAVVTGETVARAKPDPEPYLTACSLLGVNPASTLAIEDSETGTTSAQAAGCTVLVVPNSVPVAAGPARVFVKTLQGLTYSALPRPPL